MEWYQNKMYLESMKLKYGNAIQNHEYRRFKLHQNTFMEVSMFPIIHHLSFMKKIKKVTWDQTFCKMNPLKISPLTKETECSILDHEKIL